MTTPTPERLAQLTAELTRLRFTMVALESKFELLSQRRLPASTKTNLIALRGHLRVSIGALASAETAILGESFP